MDSMQKPLAVTGDPQCTWGEASKAVNISEEYPSSADSCQCFKSATVNITAPLVKLFFGNAGGFIVLIVVFMVLFCF